MNQGPGMSPPPPPAGNYPPPGAPAPKGTPWGKIIGCGCLIIFLLVGGCGAWVWYQAKKEGPEAFATAVNQVQQSAMPAISRDLPDEAEAVRAKFVSVENLIRSGQVGLINATMVTATIKQRVDMAIGDGSVTEAELRLVNEVLDDVIAHPGSFDVQKYQPR